MAYCNFMKILIWLMYMAVGGSGVHGSASLLPNDPHLVVGDTLVLNCTVEAPYNSSGIIFVTADGTVDPKFVHIVSTTTAQLVIPNIQAQARPYTCKWPLHGDDFPSQMVQVSVRPTVKNFACRVHNWEWMVCRWEAGDVDEHLETNYTLLFTIDKDYYHCNHQTDFSCTWKKLDGADSFQFRKTYKFKVIATNKVASTTLKTEVNTKCIVEPDQVKRLRSEVINSTTLRVTWASPSPLPVHRPAMYRVTYQHVGHPRQEPIVIANGTDQTMVLLVDLHPNTQFGISVAARRKPQDYDYCDPILNGFWGEENEVISKTDSDVPSALPGFASGAYRLSGKKGNINAQIFWQRIDPKKANGPVKKYRITVKQCPVSKTKTYSVPPKVEHCITKDMDMTADIKIPRHTFHVEEDAEYSVSVSAASDKGFNTSLKPAWVRIMPDTLFNKTSLNVVALQLHDNSTITHVKVNWSQIEGATGYTVYWCFGKLRSTCEEDVHWLNVAADNHEARISLDNRAYMFAVSAEYKGGSTGMSPWTNCTYINDAESVPVKDWRLSKHQAGESLTMEWTPLPCGQHVYVMHYILSYCLSEEGICTGKRQNVTIPGYLTAYKLLNLAVDQQYRAVLYTVAPSGASSPSRPVLGTVVPSGLRVGHIAGIVIGAIVVLAILIVTICLTFGRLRKVKRKFFDMRIKVPERIPHPPPANNFIHDIIDSEDDCFEDNVTLTPTGVAFTTSADARHYQDNKENFRREGNIQANGHLPHHLNSSTLNDESLASGVTLLSNLGSESETEDDNVFQAETARRYCNETTPDGLDCVPEEKHSPGRATVAAMKKKPMLEQTVMFTDDEEYHKFSMGKVASSSSPVLDKIMGTNYMGIINKDDSCGKFHDYVQDYDPSFKHGDLVDVNIDEKLKMRFTVNGDTDVNSNNNSNSSLHNLPMNSSLTDIKLVDIQSDLPVSKQYDSGFQCGYSSVSSETSPEKMSSVPSNSESIRMNSFESSDEGNNSSKSSSPRKNKSESPVKGSTPTKPLYGNVKSSTDDNSERNKHDSNSNKHVQSAPKNSGYVTLPDTADQNLLRGSISIPAVAVAPYGGNVSPTKQKSPNSQPVSPYRRLSEIDEPTSRQNTKPDHDSRHQTFGDRLDSSHKSQSNLKSHENLTDVPNQTTHTSLNKPAHKETASLEENIQAQQSHQNVGSKDSDIQISPTESPSSIHPQTPENVISEDNQQASLTNASHNQQTDDPLDPVGQRSQPITTGTSSQLVNGHHNEEGNASNYVTSPLNSGTGTETYKDDGNKQCDVLSSPSVPDDPNNTHTPAEFVDDPFLEVKIRSPTDGSPTTFAQQTVNQLTDLSHNQHVPVNRSDEILPSRPCEGKGQSGYVAVSAIS